MQWHYQKIAFPKAASIAHYITQNPHSIWLDSGLGHHDSKLSIFGLLPKAIIRTQDIQDPKFQQKIQMNPTDLKLPFSGGFLAYVNYEGSAYFVKHQLYFICDHLHQHSYIICDPNLKPKLNSILKKLASSTKTVLKTSKIQSNFNALTYHKRVLKIIEHLKRGDAYQVNFAQQFKFKLTGSTAALYLKLRKISPAPFMAFINDGKSLIVSNSPENFFRLHRGKIITRPIKGTRPRSQNKVIDTKLKSELYNSPKDNAELLMIVDLMRNDLGKICETGTVKTACLKKVESFNNVHHLVASIKGVLKSNVNAIKTLAALFPAGSITGAPKIKAMELINRYENRKRNIYTGCIGYIDDQQNAVFSVAIRTALIKKNWVYLGSGGGIVVDSDPKAEYEETLHKARSFFEVIGK